MAREKPATATETFVPGTVFGLAVTAGGGVTDFTSSNTRNVTGTGGSWDVRVLVGSRSIFAVEGSYIGSAQGTNGLGLTSNNTLIRNGFEGVFRLQAPITLNAGMVEPYIFGGLGWNRYMITSTLPTNASVSATSDAVLTVPAGVGFAGGYRGFYGDVRFTYRPTYNENIFGTDTNMGLTNWDFGGSVGYEF